MEETEVKEQTVEEEKPAVEKISKSDRIKYAIMGIVLFLCIPLSNLAYVFKPLYKKIYYGQSNPMFYYGIASFILLVCLLLVEILMRKKLHITYKKEKGPLNIINTCIVFFGSFLIVFIISAIIGFHVKPFYDLGNNTTGFKIYIHGIRHIYYVMLCLYIVFMIENFQYALDNIVSFKNEKINQYIPYGGICTMLTYGTYALVRGIGTLPVLFYFMIIIYGEIYLLTNRNILKSFAATLLIFVL